MTQATNTLSTTASPGPSAAVRTEVSNKRLLLQAALAAPVATLVLVMLLTGRAPAALLCAMGVASLAACMWPVLSRPGRVDLFHPFMLIGLSVALGTTGRSFYLCFSESPQAVWLRHGDRVEDILPGGLLVLIGCVSLAAGALAMNRVRIGSTLLSAIGGRRFVPRRLGVLTAAVVVATGVLTVDMLHRTDSASFESVRDFSRKRKAELSSNDTNQKFAALGYHRLVCYTLASTVYLSWLTVWARRGRPGRLLPLVVGLGMAACVYPFLTSSRASVLFLMINTAVVLYVCRVVGLRGILLTAAASVACLTIMKGFREAAFDTGDFSRIGVVDSLVGQRNMCGVVKTAHIHNALGGRLDHYHGTTLLRWVVAPIPRELWPAKPAVSLGYELTETLYGRETFKGGGTPPGFVGEMLLNFGVAGVPVGCFFLGCLVAVFYNSMHGLAAGMPAGVMLYVLLLLPMSFNAISGEVSRNVISVATSLACLSLVYLAATVRAVDGAGSDTAGDEPIVPLVRGAGA